MIDYILIKTASRCNLDCSYCYWFRDPEVYSLPAALSQDVIDSFCEKLTRHIRKYRLRSFTCSFHGGEPLLIGKNRFKTLLQELDQVGSNTRCFIKHAVTTNGLLIDEDWADLFKEFTVSVAVSIDGPEKIHDLSRPTVTGKPSWKGAVNGYFTLCRAGIAPSILAVGNPDTDPEKVLSHLFDDLGATFIDVLVPDENYESKNIPKIADYYIRLFDTWFAKYRTEGVEVRIITQMIRGLIGLQSQSDQIGFGPTQTVCLNTNGRLEPHDVVRMAGNNAVATGVSILENDIDEILSDPAWKTVRDASINLHKDCQTCRYVRSCGGGHVAQRWSQNRQYNNVSVYCQDYQKILSHMAIKLAPVFKDEISSDAIEVSHLVQLMSTGLGLSSEVGHNAKVY